MTCETALETDCVMARASMMGDIGFIVVMIVECDVSANEPQAVRTITLLKRWTTPSEKKKVATGYKGCIY